MLAADVFTGNPDSYVLGSNTLLAIAANNGVLANDFSPYPEALDAVVVNDVEHGALELQGDGSFTYMPDLGFLGVDAFSYKMLQANQESVEIEVEIRVTSEPIVVSEFMAANGRDLLDEDGDSSDWIELSNLTSMPIDLTGWYLTDDQTELDKWQFPETVVPSHSFQIVFASGKDRVSPYGELHTNFRLSAAGEYLGLSRPDMIVVDEYAPVFPPQLRGASYGRAMSSQTVDLLSGANSLSYIVPAEEDAGIGNSWVENDFDDSLWKHAADPQSAWALGYARGRNAISAFGPLLQTDVIDDMLRKNTSIWIRQTFSRNIFPWMISRVTFSMRYDDGFVAYLNGTEVVQANAPSSLQWDSAATDLRPNDEVVSSAFEWDISDDGYLIGGTNVLAIQGLNKSANSADLFIEPKLLATSRATLVENVPIGYFDFREATPGAPNGEVTFSGQVSTPESSVDRGLHAEPFDLVIHAETPGATLVVTTDGSTPTLQNGTVVMPTTQDSTPSTTIRIDRTSTVRAAELKDGMLSAHVSTHTYLFLDDIITQDYESTIAAGLPAKWDTTSPDYGLDPDVTGPNDLFDGIYRRQILDSLTAVPSLSLVLDVDDMFGTEGIYSHPQQSGSEWERATSVELIHTNGEQGFQIDAGIRIQGGAFRGHGLTKKKSFRLAFREQYGASTLDFPFFGEGAADEFDDMVLRANNNDGWQWGDAGSRPQYVRDEWFRATQRAMGHISPHGNLVHLYINGAYWGLYNPVERPDAAFSASYLGAQKEDWDALNHGTPRGGLSWGLVDGTDEAWTQMNSLAGDVATANQTVSNVAFQRLLGNRPDGTDDPALETLLDVQNMIDYMILNIYGGNWDWSRNNWYAGRLRGSASTGFQYYSWDAEYTLGMGADSLGHSDLRIDKSREFEDVANVYHKLRANDEFRLLFADHVHRHFFNAGTLYVDPDHPGWDAAQPERNVPAALYWQLTEAVSLPLVAESARWGDQHRARPYTVADWERERDNLLGNYFPQRSAIVLQQFQKLGLYPNLGAPQFNQHSGTVADGFALSITAPGDVYYTVDGTDPRRNSFEAGPEGAGIAQTAIRYNNPIVLSENLAVKARTFADGQWSALNEAVFTLAPPSLLGELSGDSVVDATDIDLLFLELARGTQQSEFDLNADGAVDMTDADELVRNILDTQFGDADLDGDVDFTDFGLLANHFGSTESSGWATGDFDGDRAVSFRDFVLLTNQFGFTNI